jgi:hypothetical protein
MFEFVHRIKFKHYYINQQRNGKLSFLFNWTKMKIKWSFFQRIRRWENGNVWHFQPNYKILSFNSEKIKIKQRQEKKTRKTHSIVSKFNQIYFSRFSLFFNKILLRSFFLWCNNQLSRFHLFICIFCGNFFYQNDHKTQQTTIPFSEFFFINNIKKKLS